MKRKGLLFDTKCFTRCGEKICSLNNRKKDWDGSSELGVTAGRLKSLFPRGYIMAGIYNGLHALDAFKRQVASCTYYSRVLSPCEHISPSFRSSRSRQGDYFGEFRSLVVAMQVCDLFLHLFSLVGSEAEVADVIAAQFLRVVVSHFRLGDV